MKLYVHYEDTTTSWTKRLTVAPSTTTIKEILEQFTSAYNIKFKPKPMVSNYNVFTERHQSATTRRQISNARYTDTLEQIVPGSNEDETCDIELVIVPTPSPPSHDLSGALHLAMTHMKARNYRAARETYEILILSVDPTHADALFGCGEIYSSMGQYTIAWKRYYWKCWLLHHEHPVNKIQAMIVFQCALYTAECQIAIKKYHKALQTIDVLQQYIRKHRKCKGKGYFNDLVENERMEAQIDYLRANALYDLQSPKEQETAIALLMHLLPDLQDPQVNLDALQLYARVAHDRGKKNEALSMILRVLVGRSTDKRVKQQFVHFIQEKGGMERLLFSVPATTPSAAAAYAFMATILKEYGVIDASLRCFEHAISVHPSHAAYVLNYAHVLEVGMRYEDAYNALLTFFRRNPSLHVFQTVTTREFAKALEEDGIMTWNGLCCASSTASTMAARWSLIWKENKDMIDGSHGNARVLLDKVVLNKKRPKVGLNDPNESELDLLACFVTLVKILFLNGALLALPRLIALIEPLCIGRNLRDLAIRNELVYYKLIVQLMSIKPSLLQIPIAQMDSSSTQYTFVCGDSHTMTMAWREIQCGSQTIQLRPALVTGLKHWHLRPESQFYPKQQFWNVLGTLPRHSRVIFNCGEIDCRDGILRAVERCKYDSIEEGMKHTIRIYMNVLTLVAEKYEFEMYIHPIVPVLNETRPLVLQYNKLLKEQVMASSMCKWLDFLEDLLEGYPQQLRSNYQLDGTHLHPCYLSLVARELSKYIT